MESQTEANRQATPTVDVVILTSGRSEYLAKCIDSIRKQEYQGDLHLIVVAHNSVSDQVLSMAREVEKRDNPRLRFSVLSTSRNLGVPGGRHTGASFGAGELIIFLDDDAAFPEVVAISQIASKFSQGSSLGAAGFRIELRDTGRIDEQSWVYPSPSETTLERNAHAFVGAGHVIRRRVYDLVHGYDPQLFFYWEELDISMRIINAGFTIAFLPSIRVEHWRSAEGRVDWARGRFWYYAKNGVVVRSRYYGPWIGVLLYGCGYIVRGLIVGHPTQAILGVLAALGEVLSPQSPRERLSVQARTYLDSTGASLRASVRRALSKLSSARQS